MFLSTQFHAMVFWGVGSNPAECLRWAMGLAEVVSEMPLVILYNYIYI